MGALTGNPTWEDYPSEDTPLTAARLNAIEAALDSLNLRTFVTTSATAITAASSDNRKFYRLTATGNITVTLPSGVAVGTQIEYQACAAGLAAFVLGVGASWGPAPMPSAVMKDTGSAVTVLAVAADTWTMFGRLA